MERVIFRIEESGQSISCLLNPESMVLRRTSGIRCHETAGGVVSGSELADDPLLFTGGGRTELTVDLLFDMNLGDTVDQTPDVRSLTGPLWQLAENARRGNGDWRPARVHLFWGKERAMLGIIAAIAERLDYFTPNGIPQRSWLRLRMLRVADLPSASPTDALAMPDIKASDILDPHSNAVAGDGTALVHEIQTDGDTNGDRLDDLAWRYYGDPAAWRQLAWFNDIENPLRLETGSALQIAAGSDRESLR